MQQKREEYAANLLRRYQASFLAAAVVLVTACGFQLLNVSSASSAAMQRVASWTQETQNKWSAHAKVAADLPRLSVAATPGLDVAKQFGELWERAEAALAGLEQRVKGWLEDVKRGWAHGEEHFRMFHTHDRPDSSPLKRINLPISVTTRNTNWKSIGELALLKSLLPSLLRTIESGYLYGVYLGIDAGDRLLDQPGAEEELRRLWDAACSKEGKKIELRMFVYSDTAHKNVWAVNYITKEAYLDGYDYFFRVNDDSEFKEGGWTSQLVEALQRNEDFGAAGVLDPDNPRIWTHSFVGRQHIEIFGFHFPFSFGNYWSDDWITTAYDRKFSVWLYEVPIGHHRHKERYTVNWTDSAVRLSVETDRARLRWRTWLCRARDASEYCGNATVTSAHEHHALPAAAQRGYSREVLLAMENKAKAEQFRRLKRKGGGGGDSAVLS
jgi:hypothetical protein